MKRCDAIRADRAKLFEENLELKGEVHRLRTKLEHVLSAMVVAETYARTVESAKSVDGARTIADILRAGRKSATDENVGAIQGSADPDLPF